MQVWFASRTCVAREPCKCLSRAVLVFLASHASVSHDRVKQPLYVVSGGVRTPLCRADIHQSGEGLFALQVEGFQNALTNPFVNLCQHGFLLVLFARSSKILA